MQLVAGVAGALVLGPVGLGLTTAAVGFAAGSAAYGIFGPRPRGPGPGDLSAPALQLGSQLGRPYGRCRFPVSPIASSRFRAIEHSGGGGKGAPSGPSTYTFEIDLLGVVCDTSRVIAVTREWWNKQLITSNLSGTDGPSLANSQTTDYYGSVTDFFGGPSQQPAPLYEDREGAGNVPANLDMHTREYASIQCGQAKTLPQMEVEVLTSGTSTGLLLLTNFAGADPDDVTSSPATYSATGTPTLTAGQMVLTQGELVEYTASKLRAHNGIDGWTFEVLLTLGDFVSEPGTTYVSPLMRWLLSDTGTAYLEVGVNPVDGVAHLWVASFNGSTMDQTDCGPIVGSHFAFEFSAAGASFYHAGTRVYQSANLLPSNLAGSGVLSVRGAIATTGDYWNAVTVTGVRSSPRLRYDAASYTPPTAFGGDELVWTPTPEMLSDVILAELGQHPEFDPASVDVSDVEDVEVHSFIAIGDPATNVAELCDMLYVDIVPGNPIKFVKKGRDAVGSIPYADTGVGAEQPGERFGGLKQGGEDEITGVKAVSYVDLSRDHNPGFQRADRRTNEGPDVQRITTRLGMDPEEARGRAITAALMERLRKDTATFGLSNKYAYAEPGDAFNVTGQDGTIYRLAIGRLSYANGVLDIEWQRDDPSALIASGATDVTDEPGLTVPAAGVASWLAMDMYQLQDAHDGPGYYLASRVSDRTSADAYESATLAGTYSQVVGFSRSAVFGTVTAITGALRAGNLFNEDGSLTVNVPGGTLTSATRAALLASRSLNAFAVGINGRWVAGQFRTATPVSTDVYTLSGILLDRFEDGRYVGDLEVGDSFCLLSTTGGIARLSRPAAQLGVEHFVKVVPIRRTEASVTGTAVTVQGVSQRPLSPVGLHTSRNAGTGDITITWLRRTRLETRFGGDLGDSCPLGEASEAYRVRLYSDATFTTLVRDLGTVTTASATYTSAQRSTDGHSLYSPIYPDVRMVSAAVGEGYPLQVAA